MLRSHVAMSEGRPMRTRLMIAVLVAAFVGACADTRPSNAPNSTAATPAAVASPSGAPTAPSTNAPSLPSVAVESASATPTPASTTAPSPSSNADPTPGPSEPGPSGRPLVGDPQGATSADLIRAAVDAGSLDDATGLLYRIYAVFGDPRLPAQFATGGPHEDVEAMMRAPLEIDRLPPAVAAELRPYLARPTDPSSPFFDIAAGEADQNAARLAAFTPGGIQMTVRQAAPAAVTCDPATHWGSAVGTHRFRVWGRCGDPSSDGQITTVVGAMDGLWEAETTYMAREPNEDAGTPDQGGDTRIDIYLVAPCQRRNNVDYCLGPREGGATFGSKEFIIKNGVNTTSAFILIDRALVGSPLKLRVNLAHELFHAIEYSYNSDGFFSGDGAMWLLDASATWAEWRFVQGSGPAEISPRFFGFQGSEPVKSPETRPHEIFCVASSSLGLLIQAGPGSGGGVGARRTNRSGWAA